MKRAGFTMIELIFVIVILGILAAVAIPKLAATRSDAEGAKVASDLATCVGDAGGAYLKYGVFQGKINNDGDDKAWTVSGTMSSACDSAIKKCFVIKSNDAKGELTVQHSSDTSNECKEAQRLAQSNNISNSSGVVHKF